MCAIKEFYTCDHCGHLPSNDNGDMLGKHVRGFDVKWKCPSCGRERAQ